ncbi:N-carbamoylsarcosine amidase [Dendryphion nanum]|uniref:N-carbamoylsarcosine amidase n=1 Tax=Dendryphion nanum TaxID=256645 RepID=A0A9P9DKS4_9PLEO|nr:N-carbamoylsarcosine amidase [Dendryphion nanum]
MAPPSDHAAAASAHESYVKSGFSNKIGWGSKPALLLVDVCNAYWTKGSPLDTSSNPASAAAPASIGRLVAAAREGQVPLIWTRVEYTEPDMSDAGVFFCKAPVLTVFQKGRETGLEAWLPGLEPQHGEMVIPKRYPSAFFATDLNTRLQLKGVDTLVVCGVSTSGCVRASTLDAMCWGFKPMVVSEACGDRSPQIHDANMFDMNAKMADVVPESEAIERLRRGWP